MKTGEGKTLTGTLAVCLNALAGKRRPRRHGQRLPRAPRRRVDEPDLRRARLHRRASCRTCRTPDDKIAAYAARHHLRHELRVRLRLPARQHGAVARGEGPARRAHRQDGDRRMHLRDRRRGRQHPHRRGAHAADHLRRARAGRRPVRKFARLAPQLESGKTPEGMDPRAKKDFVADFDYEFDEKHKTVAVTERAWRRPRSSSASTTSTAPRTATSSTT